MGSGKSWSSDENLMACQAFVRASENCIKGSRQKAAAFEASISSEYALLVAEKQKVIPEFFVDNRTGTAIMQRFKSIRRTCLEYERNYQAVIVAKPTGCPSETELHRAALACFNSEVKVSKIYEYFGAATKNPGEDFAFFNCYSWLKTTSFWMHISDSIDSTRAIQSSKSVTGSFEEAEKPIADQAAIESLSSGPDLRLRRPVRAKRAADNIRQIEALQKGATGNERLTEQSKRRNLIAEGILDVERKKARMTLFNMECCNRAIRVKFMKLEQSRELQILEREIIEQEEYERKSVQSKKAKGNAHARVSSSSSDGSSAGSKSFGKTASTLNSLTYTDEQSSFNRALSDSDEELSFKFEESGKHKSSPDNGKMPLSIFLD